MTGFDSEPEFPSPDDDSGKPETPSGVRRGTADSLCHFLQQGSLRETVSRKPIVPDNIKTVMVQPKRVKAFDEWRKEKMGYQFEPSTEIGPKLVTKLPKEPTPDDELEQLIESGRLVKHEGKWILAEKLPKGKK